MITRMRTLEDGGNDFLANDWINLVWGGGAMDYNNRFIVLLCYGLQQQIHCPVFSFNFEVLELGIVALKQRRHVEEIMPLGPWRRREEGSGVEGGRGRSGCRKNGKKKG
ncbi:hypothetical protein SESBI_03155 [Sesbania bispinosa]|nr:hypothetical protein SESBI_03155 [Sesbania bispinosa]